MQGCMQIFLWLQTNEVGRAHGLYQHQHTFLHLTFIIQTFNFLITQLSLQNKNLIKIQKLNT